MLCYFIVFTVYNGHQSPRSARASWVDSKTRMLVRAGMWGCKSVWEGLQADARGISNALNNAMHSFIHGVQSRAFCRHPGASLHPLELTMSEQF